MSKILKKSISILIILSFLSNNSFFIAEEIITTVLQSRDDKLSVIAQFHCTGEERTDAAISSKLSISKEFTTYQTQAILEEVKKQIELHGNYNNMRIEPGENDIIRITFSYQRKRNKVVELRLDEYREYYSIDVEKERLLKIRIQSSQDSPTIVYGLLQKAIELGQKDIIKEIVKIILRKIQEEVENPMDGFLYRSMEKKFLEDFSAHLINNYSVQSFLEYIQVWQNFQIDKKYPILPKVNIEMINEDKRMDVEFHITRKKYYDALILLGLICRDMFFLTDEYYECSFMCWNDGGQELLPHYRVWPYDIKQKFKQIFSKRHISLNSIYSDLREEKNRDLRNFQYRDLVSIFYKFAKQGIPVIKYIREIYGSENVLSIERKIQNYYGSRLFDQILSSFMSDLFNVILKKHRDEYVRPIVFSAEQARELRDLLYTKIEKFEIMYFFDQLYRKVLISFEEANRIGGDQKKRLIYLLSSDIIVNWDELKGSNISEKIDDYTENYLADRHLNPKEGTGGEEGTEGEESEVVNDEIRVRWLIEHIDQFEYLQTREREFYYLFGNTKNEILLNLFASMINFNVQKYKTTIFEFMDRYNSFDMFINMYLEADSEIKAQDILLKILVILDKIYNNNGIQIRQMIISLLNNTRTSIHTKRGENLLNTITRDLNSNAVMSQFSAGRFYDYSLMYIERLLNGTLDMYFGKNPVEFVEYQLVYEGNDIDKINKELAEIFWELVVHRLWIYVYTLYLKDDDSGFKDMAVNLIWRIIREKNPIWQDLTDNLDSQLAENPKQSPNTCYQAIHVKIVSLEKQPLEELVDEYIKGVLEGNIILRENVSQKIKTRLNLMKKVFESWGMYEFRGKVKKDYYSELLSIVVNRIIEKTREYEIDLDECRLLKDFIRQGREVLGEDIYHSIEIAFKQNDKIRFLNYIKRFISYKELFFQIGYDVKVFMSYFINLSRDVLSDDEETIRFIEGELGEKGVEYYDVNIVNLELFEMPRIEETTFIITKRMLRTLTLISKLFNERYTQNLIIAMLQRARMLNEGRSLVSIQIEESQAFLEFFRMKIFPVLMRLQDMHPEILVDLVMDWDGYSNLFMQVERDIEFLCIQTHKSRREIIILFPGLRQVFLEENIIGLGEPILTGIIRDESSEEGIEVKVLSYMNGIKIRRAIRVVDGQEELLDIEITADKQFKTIEFSNGEKLVYRVNRLRQAAIYFIKGEVTIKLAGQIGSKIRDILVPVDGEPLDISHQRPLLQSL